MAATSAANAWAVGNFHGRGAPVQTLILHWNGTAWCMAASPNPGGLSQPNELASVTATSASSAWAVGFYTTAAGAERTLIAHWNGTAWRQVPSPSPGPFYNRLSGVAATSASNAWAVGNYSNGSGRQTLIVHWNGTAWRQVPSPDPSTYDYLFAVAATSASNAWAVGTGEGVTTTTETLSVRWDGTRWKHVSSPNPSGTAIGRANGLDAIAATSVSNAWAAGGSENGGAVNNSFLLHWNGTAWKQAATPSPGFYDSLSGVVAISASNAWAVGAYQSSTGAALTLILHWNGTAWKQAASPNPGLDNGLSAVAATSSANAWAVGGTSSGSTGGSLILHWNGTVWRQVPSP